VGGGEPPPQEKEEKKRKNDGLKEFQNGRKTVHMEGKARRKSVSLLSKGEIWGGTGEGEKTGSSWLGEENV